jgi:hypothetical protein
MGYIVSEKGILSPYWRRTFQAPDAEGVVRYWDCLQTYIDAHVKFYGDTWLVAAEGVVRQGYMALAEQDAQFLGQLARIKENTHVLYQSRDRVLGLKGHNIVGEAIEAVTHRYIYSR